MGNGVSCQAFPVLLVWSPFHYPERPWLSRVVTHEPTGQLARWLDVLAECDYTITCRPGVQHRNADALSRCDGKGCLCPILEGRDKIFVEA